MEKLQGWVRQALGNKGKKKAARAFRKSVPCSVAAYVPHYITVLLRAVSDPKAVRPAS